MLQRKPNENENLGGGRLLITVDEKGSVAALQCNREALEKVFDLKC